MQIFRIAWSMGGTAALALALAGCGDDGGNATDASSVDDASVNPDASPACLAPNLPGGTNHQFVANTITLPTMGTQADDLALDIDGDGNADNTLGEVIVLFSNMADLGIQESVDEQVVGGELLYIANVDAADIVNTSSAELRMFLGEDCDSPGNPDDNFDGDELFNIAGNSPMDNLVAGPVASGAMDLGPGNMSVVTPIPDVGNIVLPLWGARLTGDLTATSIANGIIGGGIKDEDVQGVLVPALHGTISAQVERACTGTSSDDCMCDPETSGQDLVDLFDSTGDCRISLDEVQNNVLLSGLLSPDLDLFDSNNGNAFDPNQDGENDSLSLGVGFTMVNGQFELP